MVIPLLLYFFAQESIKHQQFLSIGCVTIDAITGNNVFLLLLYNAMPIAGLIRQTKIIVQRLVADATITKREKGIHGIRFIRWAVLKQMYIMSQFYQCFFT
jgi:hypothetical protein